MNKLSPGILPVCLFSIAIHWGAIGHGQDGLKTKPVLDQDKFSGKTVATSDMAWSMVALRKTNAPAVGELAPDFAVRKLDGSEEVRLRDLHREKPLVLILSSWSCDIFRESLGGLTALHHTYGPKAEFVMVYIREAHPFGGFAGHLGRVKDPKTIDERTTVAKRCKEQLRLPFLVMVDGMKDKVATRWGAWPVRAFVIETDGKVVFAGMQGPWGYLPYRGFQHGNGKRNKEDLLYSQESLEEFFKKRFPDSSKNTVPIPMRPRFQPAPIWRYHSKDLSVTPPFQPVLFASRFKSSR